MADWQMRIDFSKAKADFRAGKSTVQELADSTAKAIKAKIADAKRIDLEQGIELEREIVPLFEEIAEYPDMTIDDYDNALDELYDWADTPLGGNRKMCWVVPA